MLRSMIVSRTKQGDPRSGEYIYTHLLVLCLSRAVSAAALRNRRRPVCRGIFDEGFRRGEE